MSMASLLSLSQLLESARNSNSDRNTIESVRSAEINDLIRQSEAEILQVQQVSGSPDRFAMMDHGSGSGSGIHHGTSGRCASVMAFLKKSANMRFWLDHNHNHTSCV